MKPVQIKGRWRIKVGWWKFGYYLRESINRNNIFAKRGYLEFNFKEQAEHRIKILKRQL